MDELLANWVRSGKKQPQRVLVRVIVPASYFAEEIIFVLYLARYFKSSEQHFYATCKGIGLFLSKLFHQK